jgi:peroxiredoxin Q/BCP
LSYKFWGRVKNRSLPLAPYGASAYRLKDGGSFAPERSHLQAFLEKSMEKDLAPGDRAPSFALMTDDKGKLSTASLKGKPYVLYFYPKDDTSGCTREAIAFSEARRKFDARGITVIGISKDSLASHQKFRTKYKLKIILASDPEIETAKSFGVWIEKSLYGRRYMGMDRATFLVDDKGVIRHIWRKVKVPGHVEAVLAAASTL